MFAEVVRSELKVIVTIHASGTGIALLLPTLELDVEPL
jgi:hypothetical protein